MRGTKAVGRSRNSSDKPPLNQCRRVDFHMMSRDQMALEVEGVVDCGMSGEEPLRRSGIFEPDPTSFSTLGWLMRVFRPVV